MISVRLPALFLGRLLVRTPVCRHNPGRRGEDSAAYGPAEPRVGLGPTARVLRAGGSGLILRCGVRRFGSAGQAPATALTTLLAGFWGVLVCDLAPVGLRAQLPSLPEVDCCSAVPTPAVAASFSNPRCRRPISVSSLIAKTAYSAARSIRAPGRTRYLRIALNKDPSADGLGPHQARTVD